ncbi:allophanate hydrolase subunit 1 [Actinoplanes sp. NPDC026623]|uniref:5-oxoprolinase subunit B family protein n=1 Tax=Actinoplanes sp. NPDC026623 TaxID=3155610 RepID=UPI00340E2069
MTRFLRCGREAVLVEVDDLDAALSLYAALRSADLPGVVDLVPAARTVLIHLDPAVTSPAAVERATAGLPVDGPGPGGTGTVGTGTVEIPVRYDGPDLADVARHTGLTPDGVIALHTGSPWTVAFAGFTPGFGYLTGGDPRLDVPRRTSPRARIPAGSVGLAGRFSGVYPSESPGGWQLIGSTTERMWDLDRPEPALLVPGVRVTFRVVPR